MPTISAFLSQANRAYSTLTGQLKAVIIEVSTVRLRTNQLRVHEVKCLPPNFFNVKVLVFAELRHVQSFLTTANLSYDQC